MADSLNVVVLPSKVIVTVTSGAAAPSATRYSSVGRTVAIPPTSACCGEVAPVTASSNGTIVDGAHWAGYTGTYIHWALHQYGGVAYMLPPPYASSESSVRSFTIVSRFSTMSKPDL